MIVASNNKNKRGFTLMMASIIASLVLNVGMAIYAITTKQIVLSGLSENSQYAFYGADTGAELALFNDFRDKFGGNSGHIKYNGNDVSYTKFGNDYNFTFEQNIGNDEKRCVVVKVTKLSDSTTISSRGYSNECNGNIPLLLPKTLEREVKIPY